MAKLNAANHSHRQNTPFSMRPLRSFAANPSRLKCQLLRDLRVLRAKRFPFS